jgi:hypothetical protein
MKYLLLTLLVGCEGLTSIPHPSVVVLKRTEADCFAVMTGDRVAPELNVPALCPDPVPPRLYGGDDRVEVVIDYGPDVDFAGASAAPKPNVMVTVDGAVTDEPIEISQEHRVGGRVYFIATFLTPKTPSIDMQVTAGVDAEFQTTVSTVFTIVIPSVSLSLLECIAGQACVLTGATGNAHVRVSVLGTEPQTVLVHTLLDSQPLPDTLPPVITDMAQGHTEHTTAIPVPPARDGAQWLISAQIGAEPPTNVIATIQAPAITSTLSCGNSCALVHGAGSVGLAIVAPGLIHPLQALVDTSLNGVPQLVAAPVTLVVDAVGHANGLLAVPIPSTAGSWQVDVSVGGYSASSIVTTVQ